MVMPSWAPESWKDSSRSARRTVRARGRPRRPAASISARSTVTSENSAATKTALPAVSSTNASSGNSVVSSSAVDDPSPRPLFHAVARARLVTRIRLSDRSSTVATSTTSTSVTRLADRLLSGDAVAEHRQAERAGDRDGLAPRSPAPPRPLDVDPLADPLLHPHARAAGAAAERALRECAASR